MAVTFYKVFDTSTYVPTSSGAASYDNGFYINPQQGFLESITIRYSGTLGGSAVKGDFANIISRLRLVYNGATMFDYQSQSDDGDRVGSSRLSYLLNTLGGRTYQEPIAADGTSLDYYLTIPLGVSVPVGVSTRVELHHSYLDADDYGGGALSSAKVAVWCRFNSAVAQQTRVNTAQSFDHSATTQQVTIYGDASAGQMAGILIQNDADEDQLNGIQIIGQSMFEIPKTMLRLQNGDLANMNIGLDPSKSSIAQTPQVKVAGCLFIPLYNLTAGADAVILVNSSAATTRFYSPIFVRPVGEPHGPPAQQNAAEPNNTTGAVINRVSQ